MSTTLNGNYQKDNLVTAEINEDVDRWCSYTDRVVMGCSSSQQEQHTNSNEAQVVVSNQNTAAGGLQTENESGEGEQTGSDLQEDKRLGISSLRENDIFGAPHKPGIKNRNSFERGERSSQRATVANAWGTSNTRKNVELSGISDGLRDGTTDFENEYGRDGVDMTSSKVTKNRDTDKENSGSPSFRTSPADQTLYDGFASQLNRQRFQRKVNTTISK